MKRYGPAGIPLSSKGRTIMDGIEEVHMAGLNAIEIQMIKQIAEQRPPEDYEVGMRPEEINQSFIVEVGKPIGDDYVFSSTGKEIIEEDDLLTVLHMNSVAKNYHELRFMRRQARMLDVKVGVHTQYYIDLISNDEITHRSMDNIMWSGIVAREVGADIVVTHIGPYGDIKKKEAMKRVKENLRELIERYRRNGISAKIGVETSGKQELFGSLTEIMTLAKDVDGVVPILNYAHIHSREDGRLKTAEDFLKLFRKVRKYLGPEIYSHFSGVEYDDGNEIRLTPIKKGDLKFEPLAEALLQSDENFVLICDSPLLEHDAMYMKVITERTLSKKIAKEKKEMERLKIEREKEENMKKQQDKDEKKKEKEVKSAKKTDMSKKEGKKGTEKKENKDKKEKKEEKKNKIVEKKDPAKSTKKEEKKEKEKKAQTKVQKQKETGGKKEKSSSKKKDSKSSTAKSK